VVLFYQILKSYIRLLIIRRHIFLSWTQNLPPETTSSTRFHDVTFKETVTFILTAVRAMNTVMMIMKNSNESPTHSTCHVCYNYNT